jgi:hypothetical protein
MGAFAGFGGQITFGRNPNGSGFMNFQFGFGIGGGLKYDPLGKQPGYTPNQCDDWGVGLGAYGQANINLGPAYAGVGMRGGKNTNRSYSDSPKPHAGLRGGMGIGASAHIGGEVTVYGGGKLR